MQDGQPVEDVQELEDTSPENQTELVHDAPPTPAEQPEEDTLKLVKRLLGRHGRLEQETSAQIAALQQQNARILQHLQGVAQQQSVAQQRAEQQYLDSLPEEQREVVRLQLENERYKQALQERQQTAGGGQPGAAQPPQQTAQPQQADPREHPSSRQMADAMLQKINQRYGTELTIDDEDDQGKTLFDWSSPHEFAASAGAAAALAKQRSEPSVARNQKSQEDQAAQGETPPGTGSPPRVSSTAAPKPVPPRKQEPVTMESFQHVQKGYKSSRGMKGTLDQQRALREQARAKVPGA